MPTDLKNGLTEKEANERQKQFGLNEITEKSTPAFIRFIGKFIGPIPLMIELAMVFSTIVGKWDDLIIISVLLSLNIIVDFLQEQKANKALKALKATLSPKALVLRDGKFSTIPAKFLVPGDIIELKIGDVVPADAILRQGKYLLVDQSSITGESLPVEKKVGENIYGNIVVKVGEMLAEITKTGKNTFFGKNVALVAKAEKNNVSHFQKAIINIGHFLILSTLFIITILVAISLLRGDSVIETFRFALILAIASIPVALPAVLSVTLAVGAYNLAKKHAVVADLQSIEELAGVDILCSDKTGTLTKNKMTVSSYFTYNKYDEKSLFTFAMLASKKENNDPIEIPIYEYSDKKKLSKNLKLYKVENFTPFDPDKKFTRAMVSKGGKTFEIIKGASQVVSKLIPKNSFSDKLTNDVDNYANKGFRTLAICIKEKTEKKYKLVGVIALYDAPRDDSARVISFIKKLGIKVKMLTGDNVAIAKQISGILKLGKKVLVASSALGKKKKGKSEPYKEIMDTDAFSEVLPEDKYDIVKSLQKHKHIVAMTGDGVNDAPALKEANIGIAVSGATDAARSSADLILLKPGLSVIHQAINSARVIFGRMEAYATFRIAETIRIVLFMSVSIIVFNFYPITAVMIIALALLNDIPVMAIAYDNAPVSPKPIRWHLKDTIIIAIILGTAGLVASFLIFFILQAYAVPLALIQTLLFIKLDVAGHSTLYLTRTGRYHFWHKPFPSLKFFIPAFGSRAIGTLIAVYGIFMEPIGWKLAGLMWLYAIVWWLINDQVKVLSYRIIDKLKGQTNND